MESVLIPFPEPTPPPVRAKGHLYSRVIEIFALAKSSLVATECHDFIYRLLRYHAFAYSPRSLTVSYGIRTAGLGPSALRLGLAS